MVGRSEKRGKMARVRKGVCEKCGFRVCHICEGLMEANPQRVASVPMIGGRIVPVRALLSVLLSVRGLSYF